MISKHLEFKIKEVKPKTDVYSIISKYDKTELGVVKWNPQWRQYCFFPTLSCETVWSYDCLYDLYQFILELKQGKDEEFAERKNAKKKK